MMKDTSVSAGTIARTICLILALLNQALTITGKPVLPIADETVNQLVSLGATVITAIVVWWKNNSFTEAAKRGDLVMRNLKKQGEQRNGV